jgi:hypothetical protein
MLIGTHALLPVCGCLLADNLAVAAGRERMFPVRSLWIVGIFGVLPDLCSPHISLEARYSSWSHTVWFMAGLVLVAAMTGTFQQNGSRMLVAVACWLASALHLAADAVSGGIAWLYPWRDDVLGSYFIPPEHWMWFDAGFVLLTWFLIRSVLHWQARGIRRAGLSPMLPDDT